MNAATWSAIAATFSAISALLIMLIQRRNLLESARPELVLTGWGRHSGGEGDSAYEVVTFKTIRNVGKGPALYVWVNASETRDNFPLYTLSTIRVPILAPNESSDVNGEILIWWENVKPVGQDARHLPITITIMHWDSRSMRHETKYSLLAMQGPHGYIGTDALAPGIMMGHRATETRAVWLLKLSRWIGYPWWGKKAKKD